MNQISDNLRTHFHIFWTLSGRMDWECFDTRADATMRAMELVQPGETFSVEEILLQCPLRGAKAASAQPRTVRTD
jgi:hypothetical protein